MLSVDLGCDLHTHSCLTDGVDTPEEMADAASAAGLHTWGLSDHVRASSDWLEGYVERVRAIRRPGLRVMCGVEAKMLTTAGALDLPAGAKKLDYVLVADHQVPSATGPISPRVVAEQLAAGKVAAADVVDDLVTAMVAAVRTAPFPPVLVHPFSVLPKAGLSEAYVHRDHLTAIADACHRSGASLEVNEKWRCPTLRVVRDLAGFGVALVAGSDAHRVADVGSRTYVQELASGERTRDAAANGAPSSPVP